MVIRIQRAVFLSAGVAYRLGNTCCYAACMTAGVSAFGTDAVLPFVSFFNNVDRVTAGIDLLVS